MRTVLDEYSQATGRHLCVPVGKKLEAQAPLSELPPLMA